MCTMKKLTSFAAVAVLAAASASASAYWGWGGPYDGFSDFLGDGAGDFNMGFSSRASSRVHGYGYGHDYPYYGGYPYAAAPVYGAPVPSIGGCGVSTEQQQAVAEQQKAMADQYAKAIEAQRKAAEEMAARQAEAYKQAIEAQRQAAEQFQANLPKISVDNYGAPSFEIPRPAYRTVSLEAPSFDRADLTKEIETRRAEVEAMRAERMKEIEARRAEIQKEMESRRVKFDSVVCKET
jgi:hypothetical protein